jgi:hypothetical protein
MGFEYKTPLTIYGWPLVHIAFGRDELGRIRVARGIVAIGQFGIGVITFAQLGLGVLFAFGQLVGGLFAVGQVAPAVFFGIGQLTTGHVAIGQLAIGDWVLAQGGLGIHVWSMDSADPAAVAYFTHLWESVKGVFNSIF